MSRTGYTIAMGINGVALAGWLYGLAIVLPWAWRTDMPVPFLLAGTVVFVGFTVLLGAALWMFGKERRELA